MHRPSPNRLISLLASIALVGSLLLSGVAGAQPGTSGAVAGHAVTVQPAGPAGWPAEAPDAYVGFAPRLEIRTQTAGLNQTVEADLVVQLGDDFPSLEATVETRGPVQWLGDRRLLLPGGKAGEVIRVPVQYVVHGLGDGQITVTVTGTSTRGQTFVHDYSLDTYAEDDTLLFGHGPMSLRLQKLDQDLARGRLDVVEHDKAKGKLMNSAGVTTLGEVSTGDVSGITGVAVSGTIKWQDNGGQLHPVRHAQVYLYSSQYGDSRTAASATTDSNGYYSAEIPASGSSQDIYLVVEAQALASMVVPADTDIPWFIQSNVSTGATDGSSVSISIEANNTTEAGQAFAIVDAMEFAWEYVGQVNGSRPGLVVAEYPKNEKDCTCYDPSNGRIYLDNGLWRGWDVIHHEYGHFMEHYYDFSSNVGGDHTFTDHLAVGRTKSDGIKMAWQEGWPTYFGTTLQRQMGLGYINLGSDSILGDTKYQSPVRGFEYDLAEHDRYIGKGEDNELAVQRVLYAVMGYYGHQQMWNWVTQNHVRTLDQFIDLITPGMSVQRQGQIGNILAHEFVAPDPIVDTWTADRLTQPAFVWDANGAGTEFPNNQFVVGLYDANYVLLTTATVPAGVGTNWTTPFGFSNWTSLYDAGLQPGRPFYWKVLGSQDDTPVTGPYDSGLHPIMPLTAVQVKPTGMTITAGSSLTLTAKTVYGSLDDQVDITTHPATVWSSDQPAIATVAADGTVTGRSAGTATIRATYAGVTGSTTITVTSPVTLTRLDVLPVNNSIVTGGGTALLARAAYSDGSSLAVTSSSSWYSSNSAVVTVSGGGYITGVSPGTATISATYSGLTAQATVTVSCASNGQSFDCPIALSGSASGSVSQGQEIYYSLSVTRGYHYTVSLTPGYGDPDLYVYDPSHTLVGSSTAGTGSTDTVSFTAFSEGPYYVRVRGSSAASYTLTRSTGSSGNCVTGSSFDCPYTLSGSTSDSVNDGWWIYYRFSVSPGSTYTVTLTPSSGDPDLFVYDGNRTQIRSSTYGEGETDSVTFTAVSAGYYFIGVRGWSAASYSLSVSGSGGNTCTTGSSFDCSYSLSGSTSGSASQYQSVYYKFSVTSGYTYTVTLTPSSGDPDLDVYNASQTGIGYSHSGAGVTDRVTFTPTGSGTYYVKVYGYSATSYTLSVSAASGGGGGGGCTAGSSFDCAIDLSYSTTGSVSEGQDKYYRFTAVPGNSYTVTLAPSSGDPDLTVYDPSHSTVGSSSHAAGTTDTVSFTAYASGYYYIVVHGFTAASYTLTR